MLMRVAVVVMILAGLLTFTGCFFFGGGGTGGHQRAFVTAPLNSGIAVYTISDITGKFSQLLGSPYPTGISPTQAVLAPSGKFVYLANGGEALLGSVGCYMLEGEGAQLFERIWGDYFAVLGLPLLPLLDFLPVVQGRLE